METRKSLGFNLTINPLEEPPEESEARARFCVNKIFEKHNDVLVDADNLLMHAVNAAKTRTLNQASTALKVSTSLMIRLTNDLRCIGHLGNMGYGLQAATVAASAFETAYMINYIGDEKDRADQWVNHDDKRHPVVRAYVSVETVVETFPITEKEKKKVIDQQYAIYRELCMAKHGNPILQKSHGIIIQKDGTANLYNGPDVTEQGLNAAAYAMVRSIIVAMTIAMPRFIECHVPSKKHNTLDNNVLHVMARANALKLFHEKQQNTQSDV